MSEEKFKEIDQYFNELDSGIIQPQELYKHKMANWSGPQTPHQEKYFYTDYIAKKLLNRQNLLDLEIKSKRAKYFVEGHDGVTQKHTNRSEEIFAKSMLGHSVEHLGKIIGYQIPLKANREDDFGKIDLVSFKDDEKTAYLIELKMADKKETLLRAALEVETYFQIVQPKPLKKYLKQKKERFGISVPSDFDEKQIKKVVLFTTTENQKPKELLPENKETYQNLWHLLSELDISIYTIPHTYPATKHINPNA